MILSYDFDWLVSGHFGRLASREDVEIQKAYIADIVANAQKAIQTVDFMSIAAQTGFENPALLFDGYLDALAAKCAELTIPTWITRLGGVDIWTIDHCVSVVDAIRVEYEGSAG